MEEKKLDIYVGQKRVKEHSVAEEVDRVNVLFDDNTTMDLTVRQWESMKSDESYDDGMVRIRKFAPLIEAILKEMLKDDVRIDDSELQFIFQRVEHSLKVNYEKAIVKLFDPTGNLKSERDISMRLIDSILQFESEEEPE